MPCFKFPSEQLKSNRRSAPRLTKIHYGGVTTAAGSRVKNNDRGALGKGGLRCEGSGFTERVAVKRTASETRRQERVRLEEVAGDGRGGRERGAKKNI